MAFVSDVSDNQTCPETITRTYSVTDDCGISINVEQIITIHDTTQPIINGVIAISDLEGCSAAVIPPAVTSVVALEALGLTISDCTSDANLIVTSSDTSSATCPIVTTRTYTITDTCNNFQTVTQTFNISPIALVISDVQSITVNACDYADQAALDTAFANWIAGFSVSGGCNPQATDISGLTAPVLCIGGATAVTYNVTDLCESGQDIATFTVTPASALVISDVANETIVAGTYTTQNDLDTAFATWLTNFTVSGGCNPQAQFAASYTAPALCGGSVSIEFNVTDLCESGQDIATFTVEGANPLIISDVQSITVNACDYTDQAALDTAFANWIAGFSVSGGVTPTGQFAASYSAPTLCTGGTTAVTYDVTDTCGSGQDTASFTVTPPTALVISDVQSITVNACDYTDQAALDTAFANWIAGFSVSGGCNPQATDISGLTAPVLCNGGATAVTYNVTDLCESGQDIATFTVTPASALVISDVQSLTV